MQLFTLCQLHNWFFCKFRRVKNHYQVKTDDEVDDDGDEGEEGEDDCMIRLTCQQGATLAFWPRQQKLEESSAALRLVRFPPHYQLHDGLLGLSSQPQQTFLHCAVCAVWWLGLVHWILVHWRWTMWCTVIWRNLHHTCKQKVQHTSRAKDPAMASILQYFRTLWLI